MNSERDWTVLFVGGASGTGKSSVAYELGRVYQVNVMEVDDVFNALKAVTTNETLPAVHYFDFGTNWMDIGVSGNLQWLTDVGKELAPGLKAIAEDHIETGVPIIIEGDFIHPELAASLAHPKVKFLYVYEPDTDQILANYAAREGGDLQHYRAEISTSYGKWLVAKCNELSVPVIQSRPWSTASDRAAECLGRDDLMCPSHVR